MPSDSPVCLQRSSSHLILCTHLHTRQHHHQQQQQQQHCNSINENEPVITVVPLRHGYLFCGVQRYKLDSCVQTNSQPAKMASTLCPRQMKKMSRKKNETKHRTNASIPVPNWLISKCSTWLCNLVTEVK